MTNFAIGGIAGMCSTCIIQPVDIVKVRLQVRGEAANKNLSPFDVARELRAQAGIKGFYKGLDSALVRQATYTTTRFGVYLNVSQYMERNLPEGKKNISFGQKCIASLMAGAIGAFVGNPADLALIRLQTDSTLPEDQRRHYRNVGDAFTRIAREEGPTALWKGVGPTMVRAMALNLGMLGPYDQVKEMLTKVFGPSNATNLGASACAGFLAAAMSLPFDNVKTKLQRMRLNADGTAPYKGMIDCALQTIKKEGPLGFYTGFPTYYVRIAPHAMLTLLISDVLKGVLYK
jgi:solute carrier family 25 (mitochondrial oxoglutarate transporter), member 11